LLTSARVQEKGIEERTGPSEPRQPSALLGDGWEGARGRLAAGAGAGAGGGRQRRRHGRRHESTESAEMAAGGGDE